MRSCVKFKKGDTVIYPQHGACIVQGTKKMEAFGATQEYLILRTVINEMTLSVPTLKTDEVGVRPPVNADELEDLVSVLSKPDPRVPSNWSRRFKNHQEKLKSGDGYQVAEVVRNLAARNRSASPSSCGSPARNPRQPKLSAKATMSGLTKVEAIVRSRPKRSCWMRRTLPNALSLNTTVITRIRCWTALASSFAVKRKPPSPVS